MITITALPSRVIGVGRVGENEHRRVAFDISEYLAQYPDATFGLIHSPSGVTAYPVATVSVENEQLIWTVTSSDVTIEGQGRCELIVRQGDTIAKSIIYMTQVLPALDAAGEAPEPWESWQTQMISIAADVDASADRAEAASEAVQDMGTTATTLEPGADATVTKTIDPETGAVTLAFGIPTGPQGPQGEPGQDGAAGRDGISPTARIEQTATGATITVTDASGTTTATLTNGQDGQRGPAGQDGAAGQPGANGQDGFSPTITVTDITGGHRVTITDATGPHSFDLMDGDVAEAPVQDVQVNGTSVLDAQGVANVPLADTNVAGVVKINSSDGVSISNGALFINGAASGNVKGGTNNYQPIVPSHQHESTFYGLAKAASADMASSSNPVGQYTDAAKIAIQKMLGIYEAPWELIREDTVTNATEADIEITVDGNGQAFELTDVLIVLIVPTHSGDTTIGDYGRIYFYNNDNEIRRIYVLNAANKLVQANSVPQIAIARLLNDRGLMSIDFYQWTAQSNRAALQIVPNSESNGLSTQFAIYTNFITKIKIGRITGKLQYRLYGKRKWQ